MTNQYVNKCLLLLTIRANQNHNEVYLSPMKMGKTQNRVTSAGKDEEKKNN